MVRQPKNLTRLEPEIQVPTDASEQVFYRAEAVRRTARSRLSAFSAECSPLDEPDSLLPLSPALHSNLLMPILKLAVFSLAYLTLAPLPRAVSYDDLQGWGAALGEMPVLRRPIRAVIAYEKFFASRDAGHSYAEK